LQINISPEKQFKAISKCQFFILKTEFIMWSSGENVQKSGDIEKTMGRPAAFQRNQRGMMSMKV
jgi:hypothetical protein